MGPVPTVAPSVTYGGVVGAKRMLLLGRRRTGVTQRTNASSSVQTGLEKETRVCA